MSGNTVLVEVPTVTAAQRLIDLVQLVESDTRLRIVYSVPGTTGCASAAGDFVRERRGELLPWPDALERRFRLVLTTDGRQRAAPAGPTLLLPGGPGVDRVPDVIAVGTYDERRVLAERCPAGVPAAVVTGDIRLARMLASIRLRDHYRRCLGVAERQTLVTVTSTWTADSSFELYPDLCRRLLAELAPAGGRVAAVLHPAIWARHGQAHMRLLLAECLDAGLLLLPPEDGGATTAIASDWVIGDRGSATVYAAAIGIPVSLAAFPYGAVRPGCAADRLSRLVPRLDHCQPLLPQRQHAIDLPATGLLDAVTSRPCRVAETLRAEMYRLLDLPQPDRPPVLPPLPDPRPVPPSVVSRTVPAWQLL